MNFDFLKETNALRRLYGNCANAEKLAAGMPGESIRVSAEVAETLAKFLYLEAHCSEMSESSVTALLADPTLCDYVRSGEVLDAFYSIAKRAERAGNDESSLTQEDAAAVLKDLHTAVTGALRVAEPGEDFPAFDPEAIACEEDAAEEPCEDEEDAFTDEEAEDERSADDTAVTLFTEHRAADGNDEGFVLSQFVDLPFFHAGMIYSVEGIVEMHEYLEFDGPQDQPLLSEYIGRYVGFLLNKAMERSPETTDEYPVTLEIILTTGGKSYSLKDLDAFLEASMSRSDTEPFSLDIRCSGNLREYYTVKDECGEVHSNLIRRDCPWTGAGMLDTLEAYKRRCDFTYKLAVYYPESADYRYKKILNGRDIDVLASGTPAILDKPVTGEWRGDFLNLWAEFDFEKYPEKLAELRRIVRECVPEEELGYCEDEWGDREGEMLCSGVTWNTKDLHEIQRFLDKLNAVLLPLGDEVKAGADGNWEIRDEFAVAAWNWTDEGFKVLGLCY